MSWEDRIAEGAYTPQSGGRIVFMFENVSQSVTLRGTAHEFPDASSTYVQRTGTSSRRYPIRAFFSGADHDVQAEAFVKAMEAPGRGKLEHPFYGTVDVVPFGEVTRRDNLKTAANQSVIDVTFFNDSGVVYPTSGEDPASLTLAAVDQSDALAAEAFGACVNTATAIDRVTLKHQVLTLLDSVASDLTAVTSAVPELAATFSGQVDSVRNSADTLIEKPATLAAQVVRSIGTAAQSPDKVGTKVRAYQSLATSSAQTTPESTNDLRSRDLYAIAETTSAARSVLNGTQTTRAEAVENAERLIATLDAVTQWREEGFKSLGEVDTGESYEAAQRAVATAAGYLVTVSFSLKQERRVVLDRARNIIELGAELYGDPDLGADTLIITNNLTGDEIIELPRGREVAYYV